MIFKFMIREGSLSQESKTAVHWLLGDAVGWEGHRLYQDRCALLSRGGQTWHFHRCIFLVSRLEAWKRNITKCLTGTKLSAELAYSHGSRCVSPEKLPNSPLLIVLKRRDLIFLIRDSYDCQGTCMHIAPPNFSGTPARNSDSAKRSFITRCSSWSGCLRENVFDSYQIFGQRLWRAIFHMCNDSWRLPCACQGFPTLLGQESSDQVLAATWVWSWVVEHNNQ